MTAWLALAWLACGGDAPQDGVPTPPVPTGGPPVASTSGGTGGAPTPSTPFAWPSTAVVLRDVTVVDVDGARGPVTVVWSPDDGRIAWVGADPGPAPPDADELDLPGTTVVPGLIDAHVHLFLSGTSSPVGDTLQSAIVAQLARGVTSVVDVGGPLPTSVDLRGLLEAQGSLSVKVTGPMLTTLGSHPCETLRDPSFCAFAATEAEGEAVALDHAALGTDGLKAALADAAFTPWPTPRLEPATLGAAAAATPGPVVVHVDTVHDAVDALDAGADQLAHPVFGDRLEPDDAADLALRAGAVHTTLGAFAGTLDLLEGRTPLDAPELHPAIAASWAADAYPGLFDPDWLAGSEAWLAQAEASVLGLHAAGARLLPASDAGYLYVPHGMGLHLELERLEALGLPRDELLAGVTAEAADVWGWSDRGRVQAGLRADLLVVDGDPLATLAVLRDPVHVVVGGVVHTPAQLLAEGLPVGDAAVCLDEGTCPGDGVCDRLEHTCGSACTVDRWPEDPTCGADAYCAWADGAAPPLVCRSPRACDPYAADSCGPFYDERCVPYDLDTFACEPAGARQVGQTCVAAGEGSCAAGLYCSPIDARCYTFCDPAEGATQAVCGAARCEPQRVGTATWFGLCL